MGLYLATPGPWLPVIGRRRTAPVLRKRVHNLTDRNHEIDQNRAVTNEG
ncbi:hypothetical protein BLL52_2435 [Rhodoferax antarcticus ANT.BR]|uniref:Uncharacterized protein n=1 Tax=Rhodoferax antarcticus ANT.BR TaxID=1111071 RepID=A0A1Q8YDS4_9BURK|nr:hypothetical protein BLL52_2435 [Rhodoferax antarcticus ANT.BR]